MKYPKKLIEVALPLDDINREASREKSIRHGHPSTLHLWWARRPLAAARAVIFAQMVNDPGDKILYPKRSKKEIERKREELFKIIRDMVKWDNTFNNEVLDKARTEIRKSWQETCKLTGENPEKLPSFLDPFSGGGSIPLEAQRLGLQSNGSDLNPVAVMMGKALIEVPTKFSGKAPIGPLPIGSKAQDLTGTRDWNGPEGLAEDVKRYAHWMRDAAIERIGKLYSEVELSKEDGGGKAPVIAWLWVRTVASPSPAFSGAQVPLASSFLLSKKKGKEVWVQPTIESDGKSYKFQLHFGKVAEGIEDGTKLGRGANFKCILSNAPISPEHIKAEGQAKRLGLRLMAAVVDTGKRRFYVPATDEMIRIADSAKPEWMPTEELNYDPKNVWCPLYGLNKYSDLFTARQMVALTTISDLAREVRPLIFSHAVKAGFNSDGIGLDQGGTGAKAYSEAVSFYLALAASKLTMFVNNMVRSRNSLGCNFRQGVDLAMDQAAISSSERMAA